MSLRSDVWQQLSSILLLMVILIPAAIGDYQRQRVPNWLTMSGWLMAPLIAWLFGGLAGVGESLLGLALMLLLLLPLWLVGWFGAADVKLMGTVGAFVGVSDCLPVMFGVLLTGMVMALLFLLYKGQLFAMLRGLMPRVGARRHKESSLERESSVSERLILPYAIPIAFGTMLSILYLQLQ
jgi:prepilin peptidase CpaA